MTIFGWDKSHYDGVGGNAKAVSEGFRFLTHKAGGDANDAELAAWWEDAKRIKPSDCLLGAYWVLYPGSPTDRADAFLDRLDRKCPGWRDRPFILQVDCEIWGGRKSTLPPCSDIEAFCDRLHTKVPKLVPIVYGPKWCYGDRLKGLSYPLWASSYVSHSGAASRLYPGDSSSRWAAYSGQVPLILQFTSSATIAGQTTCDANAYRGTLPQLTAALAPGWVTEPHQNPASPSGKEDDVKLNDKIGDKAHPSRTVGDVLRDVATLRGMLIGDSKDTKNAAISASSPAGRLAALPDQVTALGKSLTGAIKGLAAKDPLDEKALANALAPAVAMIVVGQVAPLFDSDDGGDPVTPPADLADRIEAAVRDAMSPEDSDEVTALKREVAQNRIAEGSRT